VKVWKTSNVRPLRIGKVKERKNDEETIGRKYNGLPYWAAIIKVHNRIQLLKWGGIILSAYIIASRGPTRFINTDSDSVVQSSAERYQHSPTVYVYLTINGFPYSAFPEYSCLPFSASPLHFAWVVDHAKCIVITRVCLCVCLSTAACPHYRTDPDVTWGNVRGCPLVVHYWADLQSVHGFRCCGNIARTRNVRECLYSLYAWFAFVVLGLVSDFVPSGTQNLNQSVVLVDRCPFVALSLFSVLAGPPGLRRRWNWFSLQAISSGI